MDWLFSNPIASLSGPAFLILYALVAVAIVVASKMQIAAADGSDTGPPPSVAVDRDPYEVAYLRGGGNELLRFAIFDLLRRQLLTVCDPPEKGKNPTTIVAAPDAAVEGLSSLERDIVTFYATPQTTPQLFASNVPAAAAAYGAATYQVRLANDRFYTDRDVRAAATRVRLYGAIGLIVFSGYRLLGAMVRHHGNVAFLIIETIIALIVLFAVTKVPLVSKRGRSFLQRLATALKPMPMTAALAGAGTLPILVAATGLGALAGTEYGSMRGLFPKATASTSPTYTNCSGGCGTSSGGDSSSGGGDGGGGCGGGCGG